MKYFRLLSSLLVIGLFTVFIAGCGQQTQSTGSTGITTQASQTVQTEQTSKPDNVTLRFIWWGGDARHKATLAVIDAYTKKNPNVKIDAEYGGDEGYYQKIVTQLSGGIAPDIIQIAPEWLQPLCLQGFGFVEMNKDNLVDTSGFNKDFLDKYCTIDGKLLGLPTGMNGSCLAINKNFFTKHNILLDTVWDWDNLLEIGKRVHQENKDDYLVIEDDQSFIVRSYCVQKTGLPWVSKDYKMGFDKNTLVEGFTLLKNLYDNGVIQPASETSLYNNTPTENPKWINGQGGMGLTWASVILTYKSDKVDLDVSKYPVLKDAKDSGIIVGTPQLMIVSGTSKYADEALKFLQYFFNDTDAIKTLGSVRGTQPTVNGREITKSSGIDDPVTLKAVDLSFSNQSSAFTLETLYTEIDTPYVDICNKVAFAKETPEEAADELIKQYTTILPDLKSKAGGN